jgi:hypothetical protein
MPKSAEIREIPENPDFWSISGKTQKKAFFPGILNRFFKTPRIRGGLRSRFGIKKWSIRGFPGPPEIGVFRGSGGRARKSGSRRTPGPGRAPEIRNFGRNPGFPGSRPDPQIWGSWPPPAPGLAPGLGPGPARSGRTPHLAPVPAHMVRHRPIHVETMCKHTIIMKR